MNTLPDYLRPGLRIVSIGLNPSLPSVKSGFYFANPRNRFWRALNRSSLTAEPLTPSVEAMETLFRLEGIGFTDVVKRATRGGAELRAADYRRDVPKLKAKLEQFEPSIAWFHGKQAYGIYLRYGEGLAVVKADWGAQPLCIGSSRVYVTPNPSPANAAYSLVELTRWYRRLASYAARQRIGVTAVHKRRGLC
jgi:TDG/mug DNA glycosylase family protein